MNPVSDSLYVWLCIIALAACTLITRAGFLLLGDNVPLPEGVRRALRYAPAAALSAVIVPDLLPWVQGQGPVLDWRAVAALVAVIVMVVTRNTIAMIASGMIVLWLLRWLAG
ncbi:Branched-chain amino acid transport protein (AzlD) [Pigmentiphaga humi]|uniref:Branched-chain amino acid transport protein (AzlD) n=1 Tax=Pigmentiphaga humi TaxID=2478468 RepID=A0A3P4AYS2_9BURK|nr:AzlD domain-containing protein [Pigmentiphaga humi]VCU68558.1 Branched-chain amino acid transport protein (AzlD) [Pigmentiphaga humi]